MYPETYINFLLMTLLITTKNGKISVNWEIMSGIISLRYPLKQGYQAAFSEDYPLKKKYAHYKNILKPTNDSIFTNTKILFSDLESLNRDCFNFIKSNFKTPIPHYTFHRFQAQTRKIAVVLANEGLIYNDTINILFNLLKFFPQAKKPHFSASDYIEIIDSAWKFLVNFKEYTFNYDPEMYIFANFLLLYFHLSRLGLRKNTLTNIKNSDIKKDKISFLIYKNKEPICHFFSKEFIGELYHAEFLQLSKQRNLYDNFFPEFPYHFLLKSMNRYFEILKIENNNELLNGYRDFKTWKRNPNIGKLSFILSCYRKNILVKEISAIIKQPERTIQAYLNYMTAKRVKKQIFEKINK